MKLEGKAAIITGAASGMGQAAAILFAKEGAKVVASDIDEEGLHQTKRQIEMFGGQMIMTRTDVSSATDVQAMVVEAVKAFGGVQVLYNNAGLREPTDTYATDMSEEVWDRVLDVNLKGMFLTCKYVIPLMLDAGTGAIINTASIGGLKAAESTAYGASKGGVIALTRNIALQYSPTVRANSICPGPVDTPLLKVAMESIGRARKNRQAASSPGPNMLNRWADPIEIAQLVLFLASEDASFITASNISIDGGSNAQ